MADDAGADPRRHDPGVLRASRSEGDRHAPRALLSGLHAAAEARAGRRRNSAPGSLLRQPTTRLAILSNCAGQGNMAIVMVLTSLVLSHHGHGADRDRDLPLVPCRRHVRLHHSARLGVRPLWARVGDVSGRRHGAHWRAVRRLRRGLRVGHARHVPGRARLVRGERGLDRAHCRLRRDPASRPRHRRQRKRRRRDDAAGRRRDRPAGRMHQPAGRRHRCGADRGGAVGDAGVDEGCCSCALATS